MTHLDYWKECISAGADECELKLTDEQLTALADSAMGGHECYDMAFYSPPASDRMNDIEREWKAKYAALQREFDAYRGNAETAVKQALRQYSDANVTIGEHGEVLRHGGRTERIQQCKRYLERTTAMNNNEQIDKTDEIRAAAVKFGLHHLAVEINAFCDGYRAALASQSAEPCCGEPATCGKACVERGRYLERCKPVDAKPAETVAQEIAGSDEIISYAHGGDTDGQRFVQYKKDKLPPWAVDVQPSPQPAKLTDFEELLGQYWEIAFTEGLTGLRDGNKANEILHKLRAVLSAAPVGQVAEMPWWKERGYLHDPDCRNCYGTGEFEGNECPCGADNGG